MVISKKEKNLRKNKLKNKLNNTTKSLTYILIRYINIFVSQNI
jgi:hypothetical protein